MVQTFEIPLLLILHLMFKFLLSYYELRTISLFITTTHFAYTLATRGIPHQLCLYYIPLLNAKRWLQVCVPYRKFSISRTAWGKGNFFSSAALPTCITWRGFSPFCGWRLINKPICYTIDDCGVMVIWRLYEENSKGRLKIISQHSDFRRHCLLSVTVMFFLLNLIYHGLKIGLLDICT